ncbi:MAG: CRISPR-associated endonuclease Cas2 [Candidatus Thorarchaeota archaeon]
MRVIVVYDITKDSLRGKVSESLKDYGLERIQYSTFQGELPHHALRSLETDIRVMLNEGDETDSVLFFPLCSSCFKGRRHVGAEKEMEKFGTKVSVF